MAFFDEMKNRVTQASQSAAKSAKEFSEITRLNGEISDAESRINQLYNQIGYEVYCAYSAHPLPEAADLIEQVNALHDKIENCRMQIQTINAASRCPNCGAKIRPGMAFCSGCGTRVEQPAAPTPAPAPAPAAPAQSAAFAPAPSFQQPAQPVQQPVQQPAQPAAPQTSVCPSCGEPIPADATFCINCGAKLD